MIAVIAYALLAVSAPQDQIRTPESRLFSGSVQLDGSNEVFINARLVDRGVRGWTGLFFECVLKCKGQVHFQHKVCDTSCDAPCEITHSQFLDYGVTLWADESHMNKSIREAMATFGIGASYAEVACAMMNASNETVLPNKDKLGVTVNKDHFNTTPCSSFTNGLLYQYFDVEVEWRLRRRTIIDGNSVLTQGPDGKTTLATYSIPQRFTSDTYVPHVSCACNLMEDQSLAPISNTGSTLAGVVLPGDPFADAPAVLLAAAPIRVRPKDPMLVDETGIRKLSFGAVCQDMNTGELTCDNPFATPLDVTLNPGCTFDTNADNVQDVVVSRKYECTIGVDGWLSRRGPSVTQNAQNGMRLLCLEMNKREPDPKVKYQVLTHSDPVLSRLVQLPAPRFGGALPQARVWVYTDAGTFDQISKKLMFPKLQPKDYVIAMHDAFLAGASLTKPKYAPCFDPALLTAVVERRAALKWFVYELIRRDSKKLLQWAQSRAKFAEEFASDSNGAAYAHFSRLTFLLAISDDENAQLCALYLVRNAVEPAARDRVAKEGLGAVLALRQSRHPKVVKLATEVQTLLSKPTAASSR